jgi:hypothetical protein
LDDESAEGPELLLPTYDLECHRLATMLTEAVGKATSCALVGEVLQ